VTNVTVDSPAYETGMNVDDELIAVNRFRVQSSTLDRVLGQFAGEPEVTLTLSRRGELLELPLQIRGKPEGPSKLTFIKDASKKQQTSMADWLHASEK
jgi:predicted metalloprotease with PDZ domain